MIYKKSKVVTIKIHSIRCYWRNSVGFAESICRELAQLGMEVMAIDSDEDKINEFANIASHAVIADSTDEMVLKSLGIRNFDHVVVAIGDNLNASILTTLILKELGVKNITVKAQNDYHEKVLSKIGRSHCASRA